MKSMLTAFCLGAFASAALAAATVGDPAPAFRVTDASGKVVQLSDFKGRQVVLEWVNPGCPYVQKHYGARNMQATQKAAVDKGAVWLTINSTESEHRDYLPPEKMTAWMKQHGASASAVLMDVDGKVGRAYGARTTPHMYVIDTRGVLVYAGAIDSKPTANRDDIASATNYVNQALGESMSGKAVSVPTSRAYGCTIKYAPAV